MREVNGGRTWDGREGGQGGVRWGREGGDLLYGHKKKERREGQASREETSGGREGRAGRLFLKVRQSIQPHHSPQYDSTTNTHTHTHKQTDTPSLPTTHCSYLSERLPGVGGAFPSSACMLLAAALRME